eukprot:357210-Chlamydomonas_euryale.AAC.1
MIFGDAARCPRCVMSCAHCQGHASAVQRKAASDSMYALSLDLIKLSRDPNSCFYPRMTLKSRGFLPSKGKESRATAGKGRGVGKGAQTEEPDFFTDTFHVPTLQTHLRRRPWRR